MLGRKAEVQNQGRFDAAHSQESCCAAAVRTGEREKPERPHDVS